MDSFSRLLSGPHHTPQPQAGEEGFSSVFHGLPDAVLLSDETGRVFQANAAALSLMGCALEDLPPDWLYRLLTEEGAAAVPAGRILAGEAVTVEAVLPRTSGPSLILELRSFRATHAGAPCVVTVAGNLSERRKADRALRRSQHRLVLRENIARAFLTSDDDEAYREILRIALMATHSPLGVFGHLDETGDLVAPAMVPDRLGCRLPHPLKGENVVFAQECWSPLLREAILGGRPTGSSQSISVPPGHVPMDCVECVPVVYRGMALGAMLVANRTGGYGDRERADLLAIAEFVAPVLHARLERDRKEAERRQAIDNLRQQKDILQTIFDNAPVMISLASSDGRYLYVNRCWQQTFGWSLAEVVEGEGLAMLYPDAEYRSEVLARAQASGGVWNHFRPCRRDGVRIDVEFANVAISDGLLVGIGQDISDRCLAEELARLDETRLQAVLRVSQFGADSLDDLLSTALNEAIRLSKSELGYLFLYDEKSQQFTLHAWSKEAMHDCAIPSPPTVFQLDATGIWGEAVRQRGPLIENDFAASSHLKRGYPQGHVAITRFMTIPVFSDRAIVAVLGVANKPTDYNLTDVAQLKQFIDPIWKLAERKQAEEALRVSEQHRAAAEKLAATARLAARVAHEINNPLAGLKNCFELIRDAIPHDHPNRHFAEIADREINRIARIVRQTYQLYRPQQDQEAAQKVFVRETLDDVAMLLEPSCRERHLQMAVSVAPEDLRVAVPDNSLRQVLYNVIGNAIDASPAKATITIRAHTTNGMLRIEVMDQGAGIPEELRQRVFEPFFTTKDLTRQGQGLGLGLSISQSIIESLDGSLDYVTREAVGTTFTITIPCGMQ